MMGDCRRSVSKFATTCQWQREPLWALALALLGLDEIGFAVCVCGPIRKELVNSTGPVKNDTWWSVVCCKTSARSRKLADNVSSRSKATGRLRAKRVQVDLAGGSSSRHSRSPFLVSSVDGLV